MKYGYTVQAESPSDFLIVLFQLEKEGGEGGREGGREGKRTEGEERGERERGRQKERRRWPCMKQITMQVKLCS